MGALAPVSPWIPEDDLLLKNAVEAGASLESLAKGAVQFSRKFTVWELQQRWHSLLYDPVVSAGAALHMIEFERSASTLPSKFSRAGNSKENKSISRKRNAESVRSCYYALRKRIHNEPFNSMELNFLVAPNNSNYIGNEDEPLSGHCMLGDPVSNHLGYEESNLDIIHHAFPPNGDGGKAHAFYTQFQNTVQEDRPMEQDNLHKKIPHVLGESMSDSRNRSMLDEFGQPKELPMNNDPVHGCSKFDGNQVFSSPIIECGSSFDNLEYSSALPDVPMWRTVEGISEPIIPDVLGLGDKDLHVGDTFSLSAHGDDKNAGPSGYDVIQADSNLKLEISSEEMKNASASAEGYLAELSNSLLDFTNEEELLFMDVDGKDVIDKSYYDGLSSLLLSSPNDVNQDQMPIVTELASSVTSDYFTNQSEACPGEFGQARGSHHGGHIVCDSGVQFLTSSSASNPQFPELSGSVICCVLNTEDPEIPCNDDIDFTNCLYPKSVSSVARQNFQGAGKLSSSSFTEISSNNKAGEGGSILMQRNLENRGQPHAYSQITSSQAMPELGLLHPVGDHGPKFELPSSDPLHRSAAIACGGSTQINSVNVAAENFVSAKLREETPETAPGKHLNLEKPALASDDYACYPQKNGRGIKRELDASARIQNHQASHVKVGSVDIAASELENHPILDPEEPAIESDDDVPYFSDIEAMILDMDLDPEDHDWYSSEEVARYQHEGTKRAIIRLEQGAHSYMQRAIASHGAFAILYGRHAKHYITKAEVLLGRATEDVPVDIDLGKEGRANKISRRQAIINLDKCGCFHLKNLGKCTISVNDKEIAPGQSLSLSSSCLIEIRGMPFMFETNQTRVMQYLDSINQNNQT